ncbi:hypothetical protein EGW08_002531 [Elysia chlorotica]|uniref:Uncharacterized protein n=1 Tax=Elysia chlorotica TaxID=188477 RepID=A0A433U7C3_ELYCH|nr:hypothetical protein EGW08_002531 [Elysia chlorotica]
MVTASGPASPIILFLALMFSVKSCISGVTSSFNLSECIFPRKYEGFRLESNYFNEDDQFVAVDCDLRKIYKRSIVDPDGTHTITDMDARKVYFIGPHVCVWTTPTSFLMRDYCRVPEESEATETMVLDGRVRQRFVRRVGPFHYQHTEVVTRVTEDQDGARRCLPFLSVIKAGRTILSGGFFYDVRRRISDSSIFNVDTTKCTGIPEAAGAEFV